MEDEKAKVEKSEGGEEQEKTNIADYGRLFGFSVIIGFTMLCIYIGCQRSLTLYYFEQDSATLLFMNSFHACLVPIVLSFVLFVSYLSIIQRPEPGMEKGYCGIFGQCVMRVIAFHVPIWLSVFGTYITVKELIQLAQGSRILPDDLDPQYVAGISLVLSASVGVFHELKPTWLTTDVLGLCGTYAVIAYVETVSYFAGFVFVLSMAAFDLFWLCYINLIATVTSHTKAPIMLMIPTNLECKRFQQLCTLDIMVPGLFLNILYKYSMTTYESHLFTYCVYAVLLGLTATFVIVLVREQTTPAMPLPAFFAIAASFIFTDQPSAVWNFAIKY